jgi:phosphoglycerate dehydrogenase-like enzyme
MFRRRELQAMKRTAYLVNVGRGVIVDLEDLTDALAAGEIAGAGLDVFEVEPLPPDHPLWGMDNVVITPHAATGRRSCPTAGSASSPTTRPASPAASRCRTSSTRSAGTDR